MKKNEEKDDQIFLHILFKIQVAKYSTKLKSIALKLDIFPTFVLFKAFYVCIFPTSILLYWSIFKYCN